MIQETTASMVFCVEMLGMAVMALLGIKALYNVVHFVYTTYLVATLGRNLDLSKYGPWAGQFSPEQWSH